MLLSPVNKDLQKIGFTQEEAEAAAFDRHGWRRSVAQCVQLDAGCIKVKVSPGLILILWIFIEYYLQSVEYLRL